MLGHYLFNGKLCNDCPIVHFLQVQIAKTGALEMTGPLLAGCCDAGHSLAFDSRHSKFISCRLEYGLLLAVGCELGGVHRVLGVQRRLLLRKTIGLFPHRRSWQILAQFFDRLIDVAAVVEAGQDLLLELAL